MISVLLPIDVALLHTCAAGVKADDLEATISSVSSKISAGTIGVAIRASQACERFLTIGVCESGDDAGR